MKAVYAHYVRLQSTINIQVKFIITPFLYNHGPFLNINDSFFMTENIESLKNGLKLRNQFHSSMIQY